MPPRMTNRMELNRQDAENAKDAEKMQGIDQIKILFSL